MYVSIDLVEEVIERQLRKYKTKIVNQQQAGGNFQKEFVEDEFLEDEEVNIIRTKKFGIKPKKHVFRWSFLDIISMCSLIQRQRKLMLFTREKATHMV